MGGCGEEKAAPCVDKRCYKCDFCDVVRSKKVLIRSHMEAVHKEEMKQLGNNEENEKKGNVCEICDAVFRKPAYLKQHMQCHSSERPFSCPVDGCPVSYARKDHLNRHMLKHQGELYPCPVEGCNSKFHIKSNIQRHVKDYHIEGIPFRRKQQYICSEPGCGKTFPHPSKLRRHEDSHATLEYTEVVCGEEGCLKMFTNSDCLRAHMLSCHQYTLCEICGTKQLKKNIKRHQRTHDGAAEVRIKCSADDCECSYSNKSNLAKHVKVCHEGRQEFLCRFSGCGQKFAYKHVRNNHENSGAHVYVHGDFEAADEERQSLPRASRKRKPISVEALTRKRVAFPGEADAMENGSEYLKWLLS